VIRSVGRSVSACVIVSGKRVKCLSETRGSSSDVADLRFLGFHPDSSRRSHTNAGPGRFVVYRPVYKIIGAILLNNRSHGL